MIKTRRLWCWMVNKGLYGTRFHAKAVKVAVLDVSDPVSLIKRTAVLMDTEDGTGAGFDYAAETILIGHGLIMCRHVTKLPTGNIPKPTKGSAK